MIHPRRQKKKKSDDEDDDDVLVPNIDLSPALPLAHVIYPLSPKDFFETCFRKKALHVRAASRDYDNDDDDEEDDGFGAGMARLQDLIMGGMHNLNLKSILKDTSSDAIFVWLMEQTKDDDDDGDSDSDSDEEPASKKKKSDENGKKITGKPKQLIRSIEVDKADSALALHNSGGHALYCRAPPVVEQSLVAALLNGTGLGCGRYDPSGTDVTAMGRGEVEVFVGTKGHNTDWHFDFQENFTIQLSGVKKWRLKQGTVTHPLRGCTPHYASPNTVEDQLKAARFSDPSFQFGRPIPGNHNQNHGQTTPSFRGDEKEILMKPGDILYFPAGMWHQVETVEPGISINVSLMATNYATLISGALHHLLLQKDEFRACVVHRVGDASASTSACEKLQSLLSKELPKVVMETMAREGFAQAVLPPALQHPPAYYDEDDEDEDEEKDDEDEEEEKEEDGDEKMKDATSPKKAKSDKVNKSKEGMEAFGSDDDEDDDEVPPFLMMGGDDSDDSDDDEGDTDAQMPRIPVEEFTPPDGWKEKLGKKPTKGGATVKLSKNPFASLTSMDDIKGFYKKKGGDMPQMWEEYVLTVTYGSVGADTLESPLRVVLTETKKEPSDEKEKEDEKKEEWGILRTCAECEKRGIDPAAYVFDEGSKERKRGDKAFKNAKPYKKEKSSEPPSSFFFYGYFLWTSDAPIKN